MKRVIFIFMDDVSPEWINDYGEDGGVLSYAQTNLDLLANDGMRFEQVWAYHACNPARAALMTGNHAQWTGIGSNGTVNPDERTKTLGVECDRTGTNPRSPSLGELVLEVAATVCGRDSNKDIRPFRDISRINPCRNDAAIRVEVNSDHIGWFWVNR